MMVEYAVHVSIMKGLGPEMMDKIIYIGFDDIDAEVGDDELRRMARTDAERSLYHSEDYKHYGKNWIITEIEKV
jgi:hypothetical protein